MSGQSYQVRASAGLAHCFHSEREPLETELTTPVAEEANTGQELLGSGIAAAERLSVFMNDRALSVLLRLSDTKCILDWLQRGPSREKSSCNSCRYVVQCLGRLPTLMVDHAGDSMSERRDHRGGRFWCPSSTHGSKGEKR